MKCFRIFPEMWARTWCLFSSSTLKHRVGKVFDDRGHHFNRIFFRQTPRQSPCDFLGGPIKISQILRDPIDRPHPIYLMIDIPAPGNTPSRGSVSSRVLLASGLESLLRCRRDRWISCPPQRSQIPCISRGLALGVVNRSTLAARQTRRQSFHQQIGIDRKFNHRKPLVRTQNLLEHLLPD